MDLRPTTAIAFDWALRAFGDQMYDLPTRSLRVGEEAIELMQAKKITREMAHTLVDKVYDRPDGDEAQEIGGVMMTITLYAASLGFDPDHYFQRELRRVLAKPTEHFTKRNQEKIALGLQAPAA